MKNQTVVIVGIVVVALAGAFFMLKPDQQVASDGHTDHTHVEAKVHVPVTDESQPHDH